MWLRREEQLEYLFKPLVPIKVRRAAQFPPGMFTPLHTQPCLDTR